MSPQLSVVVPVFNEAQAIGPLLAELRHTLRQIDRPAEIVIVDDGSTDRTAQEVARSITGPNEVRLIRFEQNRGQAAALLAGLQAARGDILLTLDGDGQDDPEGFQRMLPGVVAGTHDLVCGIRTPRQDSGLRRTMSSLANAVRRRLLRDGLHDAGCQLRVFRRAIVAELLPSPFLQAFLPAMAVAAGFRVTEISVHHRPRRSGDSKYGVRQLWWRPMAEMWRLRRALQRRQARP